MLHITKRKQNEKKKKKQRTRKSVDADEATNNNEILHIIWPIKLWNRLLKGGTVSL